MNSPTALLFQIVSMPAHSSSLQLACPRTEVSAQEKETIILENLFSSIIKTIFKQTVVGVERGNQTRGREEGKRRGGGSAERLAEKWQLQG